MVEKVFIPFYFFHRFYLKYNDYLKETNNDGFYYLDELKNKYRLSHAIGHRIKSEKFIVFSSPKGIGKTTHIFHKIQINSII